MILEYLVLLENLDIGSKLLIIGQADKQKWIFNGFCPQEMTRTEGEEREGV